ncbi:BZ3500_MvSof-1268-A1-R1_Chr1-3g01631 [Microbotryum saponariae]|uniref:BZ3500_MvSof-1268-A1-R1_Chr1-3g01631 protein n=1 Tax=Microbotryum saponariae TaxID=289078 RepID=A0A2X0KQ41_9BASI|nr:BZ3500_MvSof-1268-A1-R1_Chr1-3g01631 [Microbotryum saponariae]SCZ94188.1 BZ3501_MvSof-1269-A2-R1_Chr1-3g01232 [Microbotryum saponariae]
MEFGSSLDEGWRRLEGAGASAVTLLGSGNEMRNTQGTVNCKTARFVRMSMEADISQRAGEVVCFVELGVTTLKEKRLLSVSANLCPSSRIREAARPPPTAAELAQGAGPAVTAPDTYSISVFPHSTATALR